MSCGFNREILQKYVDNTIDPLEFIFLREHLNYCGECGRELDLVMTLDRELGRFFDEESVPKGLDILVTGLVNDCIDEHVRKNRLKYAINRGIKISRRVMDNSIRFMEFIPGSRRIGKRVSKTASKTGVLLKGFVRKQIGKLHISLE